MNCVSLVVCRCGWINIKTKTIILKYYFNEGKLKERSWRLLLILIKLNTNTFNSRRYTVFSQRLSNIWFAECFFLQWLLQIIDKVRQTISKVRAHSQWYTSPSVWRPLVSSLPTTNMTGDYSQKDKKKISFNISDGEKKKSCLRRQSQISWRDIKYYKC